MKRTGDIIPMNSFLNALQQTPDTTTANGALAFRSTGSDILDLFGNLNDLDPDYDSLAARLSVCWDESPETTLRLIAYTRAITRKGKVCELPIKGMGLKAMGRFGMRWLYLNHREVFIKNLIGFIEVGSWQDLWHKDFLDWVEKEDQAVIEFIASSLKHDDLARKYLPRYRSESNILKAKCEHNQTYKRIRNRGLGQIVDYVNRRSASLTEFTMAGLMKTKAKGKAHSWQQAITTGNYKAIDFSSLPGKALSWITKDKDGKSFLSRHGLEKAFIKWLDKQPALKTTSFLYELVDPLIGGTSYKEPGLLQKHTIAKQIQTIVDRAKDSKLNVMPVLDTSGSMSTSVGPTTAFNICISLGIYFSMIQHGQFKDNVIMFDSSSYLLQLQGDYLQRLKKVCNTTTAWGSTNFQSVIELIVETRKRNPNIPVEDYPDVYLVVSDMQFNPTRGTNHEALLRKLDAVGLPRPLCIWWNVSPYGNNNYQNRKNTEGTMILSGFDPAIVNMLMSEDFQADFEAKADKKLKDITPEEAMTAALSQDYLRLFQV